MKVRTGFVSNSSSSSFVLVGIHLNMATFEPNANKFDEKVQFYEKNGLDIVADVESEDVYIGDIISSDEYLHVETNVFKIAERGREVLRKLKSIGDVPVDENSIKLLTFTISR